MATVKPDFSTARINKALKENRYVEFEAGVYRLTKPLIVHSDTRVVCQAGTVFKRYHKGRMLQLYVTPGTKKYNGTHCVSWDGGSFVASTTSDYANVITLFHCSEIRIRNVSISGCRGLHSIELNACSDVVVEDCYFSGQTSKGNDKFREAIQIDFANKDGLSISGADANSPCYDGTHCEDITIRNCSFFNCPNGIGTHTVSEKEKYHQHILISGCLFRDIEHREIQLCGFKDSSVNKCDGTVYLLSKDTCHLNSGGKKKLDIPRKNKGISVLECYCVVAE